MNPKTKKVLIITVAASVSMLLLMVLVSWASVKLVFEPRAFKIFSSITEDPLFHQYLEDQKLLSQNDILKSLFFSVPQERDAGATMSDKVTWKRAKTDSIGALSLPEDAMDVVRSLSAEWIEKRDRKYYVGINFNWMRELLKFDHWSLESSRLKWEADHKNDRGLTDRKHFNPLTGAVDFRATTWATLRLMKGIDEKNPLPALEEVRHLAQLMISTENQILTLQGVQILSRETRAYKYLLKKNRAPKTWVPVDELYLRRLRRVLLSLGQWFQVIMPADALVAVYQPPYPVIGVCSALNDGMELAYGFRPLLIRSYRPEYGVLNGILTQWSPQCHFGSMYRRWNGTNKLPDEIRRLGFFQIADRKSMRERDVFEYEPSYLMTLSKLGRFPFLGRAAALYFMSQSPVNPMDTYRTVLKSEQRAELNP